VIVANTISRRYGKGVADTLTSGSHPGSNMPGRRREDDTNIVTVPALTTGGNQQDDQQSQQLVTAFHPTGGGAKGLSPTLDETPGIGVGNAGSVAVAISENQRGELLETSYSHQLTSGGGKPGQGYAAARTAAGVRRLTPIECERLQGLPDDWTRVPDTAPDSRRYAGLGDAVTSNVGEWIGRRLLEVEASYVKAAA
jgi:site-specific DNA-cytosine methylase